MVKDNKGNKFDICLMNPPYGSVGGDTLHLKFVEKCLSIAKKQIVVMPFTFVTKMNNKPAQKYKDKFDKYLTYVEEFDSKVFVVTNMPNVGIYAFDENKRSQSIKISKLNNNVENVDSLLNISEFSDYEQNIVKWLEKQGTQTIVWAGGSGKRSNELAQTNLNKDEFIKNKIVHSCKKLKKCLLSYSVGLIVNQSNGGMNAKAFSSKNGQIFTTYDEFENFFIYRNISNGYNIILFDSKQDAENCRIALQNPLLRFTLYRLQNDQQMYARVYKYIPDIDWEDDRVKTDEGLLEVCGCPEDKAKEYAEYCKEIIEKVDKGERP